MFETISLPLRRVSARTAVGVLLASTVAAAGVAGAHTPSAHATADGIPNILTLRADHAVWDEQKAKDAAAAASDAAKAAAEAAAAAAFAEAHRPHAVVPVVAPISSLFGSRWGEMHAGLDFAGSLGAPIASVTDGTIIEAGPASGFGLWVRVQQDDGTVGVYGHVNDILVTVGQQVRAGDIIATVGNRGQSTGPHLHYEVWLPGGQKTDPLPWLIGRGVQLPPIDTNA